MEQLIMSEWWAWNLYPLQPNAWPSERVTIDGIAPGHTFANKRTKAERRRVRYLDDMRAWGEGQTEPVSVVTSQQFYRPTKEDLELIGKTFPAMDAENPSWHTIEAELVSIGQQKVALAG